MTPEAVKEIPPLASDPPQKAWRISLKIEMGSLRRKGKVKIWGDKNGLKAPQVFPERENNREKSEVEEFEKGKKKSPESGVSKTACHFC